MLLILHKETALIVRIVRRCLAAVRAVFCFRSGTPEHRPAQTLPPVPPVPPVRAGRWPGAETLLAERMVSDRPGAASKPGDNAAD
jgi:hypothetical protein